MAGGVGTVLLTLGLLATPASPMALWQADARIALQAPMTAVAHYDAIARYNPFPDQRREALFRAGTVLSADVGDVEEARTRFQLYLQEADDPEQIAMAWDHIARGWLAHERNPTEAAAAFRLSFEAAPDAPEASERIMRTARAHVEAGDSEAAIRTWQLLGTAFPELASRARIGEARVRLSQGEAETALSVFDDALKSSTNRGDEAQARLGIATCLERLGDLDEALAELDQAELPGGVREARRDAMRARAAAESGEL